MGMKKSFWISLSVIFLSILVSAGQVVMADFDHDITPPVQYYNPPHERWADPDNISITKEDVQHLHELYSNPVKIDVPDIYTPR